MVNSTRSPDIGGNNSTNTTTGTSEPSTSSTAKKSSNTGAIAGGIVGGVVGLTIIAGLIWFFCFKRKRDYQKTKTYDPTLDLNAESNGQNHHLDGGEVAPFPSTSGGPRSAQLYSATSHGSGHQRDMSETGYSSVALGSAYAAGTARDRDAPSSFFTPPPAPPSNATSYPLSDEGGTTSPNQYPNPGFQAFPTPSPHSSPAANHSYPASSSGRTNADSVPSNETPTAPQLPVPPQPRQPGSLKSAVVSLPYTARPPASDTAPGAPEPPRMTVPGREVDLGPVPLEEEHAAQETLPPDYHQATQPLPGQRRPEST